MFKMDVTYIFPLSLGIRFIVDLFLLQNVKTKQFIKFSLSAEGKKTFKNLYDEDVFFLLIYNKRQTPVQLDCECFMSHGGRVSCGCWEVMGAVMGCSVRLHFRFGAPSLP